MKKIFLAIGLVALVVLPLFSQTGLDGITNWGSLDGVEVVSSVSYVVNQDFEGTGYDNGESWTESGTPDEDYTTTVKVGSHALDCSGAEYTEITVADSDDYTFEFWFYRPSSLPGSTYTLAGIRTSGGAAVHLVRINSSGALSVYTNGSDSTFTTATISADTWYRVRAIWSDSGTCSVEFNETGTFDGSGTDYTSKTGGTTSDATRLRVSHSSTSIQFIYDLVQMY